jgi:hypothetical protein
MRPSALMMIHQSRNGEDNFDGLVSPTLDVLESMMHIHDAHTPTDPCFILAYEYGAPDHSNSIPTVLFLIRVIVQCSLIPILRIFLDCPIPQALLSYIFFSTYYRHFCVSLT